MLHVALLTQGDPNRLTGGYLYQRRLADLAPAFDARIAFHSFPDLPYPLSTAVGPVVLHRARCADVLVLDSIVAAAAAPWMRRRSPPVVALVHQPPGGLGGGRVARLQAALDRLAYRDALRVLTTGEWLRGDLVAHGLPAEKVRVVSPGTEARQLSRAAPGRAGVSILCVANWLKHKGILDLIEAFARLPRGAATLHLVGDTGVDPAYQGAVSARLARPDLQGRVVVHGLIPPERMGDIYRFADVFALPSHGETYGMVYAEAMAAGLPVVGWATGNLPHLVAHEKEGLVLPAGDLAALAAALHLLTRDAGLRRRLGEGAARRAADFPTWQQSASLFFAILREAVSESRSGD